MGFLPSNYEPPKGGGHYLRLQAGDNRFRPVTSAIVGKVFWVSDGKGKRTPTRRRYSEVEAGDIPATYEQAKDFIAFAVLDRKDNNAVKILELTQRTIIESIDSLVKAEDWGDPCDHATGYDITVKRSGDGLDAKYSIMPSKPVALSAEERQAVEGAKINLDALFDGDDPFGQPSGNGEVSHRQTTGNTQHFTGETDRTAIRAVEFSDKGKFWIIAGPNGSKYYTSDEDIAHEARSAVEGGGECIIEWEPTARGNKQVVAFAPPQTVGAGGVDDDDEDSIPF